MILAMLMPRRYANGCRDCCRHDDVYYFRARYGLRLLMRATTRAADAAMLMRVHRHKHIDACRHA